MDVENGFAGSARFGSKDRGSATGRLITAAAALLSLAALAGLLVLALQNRQMQSRMEALHSTDSETLDEAREEEVDTREVSGERILYCRKQRLCGLELHTKELTFP